MLSISFSIFFTDKCYTAPLEEDVLAEQDPNVWCTCLLLLHRRM